MVLDCVKVLIWKIKTRWDTKKTIVGDYLLLRLQSQQSVCLVLKVDTRSFRFHVLCVELQSNPIYHRRLVGTLLLDVVYNTIITNHVSLKLLSWSTVLGF